MLKSSLSIRFSSTAIDATAGTILGVSVITEGEAKGHRFWMGGEEIPMHIDARTLEQVKQCADAFGANGVKVKIDHWSGFEGIVGALTNFRIAGKQLRADLQLLKEHEMFERIIEMAETIPQAFGFSISFSGTPDVIDKKALARCTELYSVDLVDMPAANPGGLFSARVDSTKRTDMTQTASPNTEPGIMERFAAFMSGKATQQLEADLSTARQTIGTLGNQIKELEGKISAHATELKTRDEKITRLETDLKAAQDAQKDFEGKVRTEAEKLGGHKSAEILAALNVKPLELKPEPKPGETGEAIKAQFRSMKPGSERTAFYAKHKNILG